MDSLIREMHNSVVFWLTSVYATPVALDASPGLKSLRKQLRDLGKRWVKRFDDAAPKIAAAYVKSTFRNTDSAFRQALKDAGWSVEFEMTPAMRELYEATLTENIGLIRSIPQQYLQQVEGVAMRSFTAGRDLHQMTTALKTLYPKAANRAVLIARDQNNKATSVVTRARRLELGITEAIWMHSNAGKTPRPTHVAMDGNRYNIAEGMWDSDVQQFVHPGELVNCRCTSRSVLPFTPTK